MVGRELASSHRMRIGARDLSARRGFGGRNGLPYEATEDDLRQIGTLLGVDTTH
jgi:hypothetical protein